MVLLSAGCNEWKYPWRKNPGGEKPVAVAKATPAPTPEPEYREMNAPAATPPPEVADHVARLDAAAESKSRGLSGASQGVYLPVDVPGDAVAAAEPKPAGGSETAEGAVANQPVDGAAPARPAPTVVSVHVPANPSLQVSPQPSPEVSANQRMDSAKAAPLDSLPKLIEEARRQAEADPTNLEKQWRVSLLELAANRPESAAELNAAIAREPATIMTRLIAATSATGQALTDPVATYDDALAAVEALRRELRADAELSVPVVALCSRVEAFGIYQELPEQALTPYQPNRAIVYCEVKNFESQRDSADRYQTLLSSRIELFSGDGKSLWSHGQDRIEDICRRQREDFFVAQLVTLPAGLAPGEYVLKVTITDLVASKTNQGVHQFNLGDGSVRAASAQ